ncbi:hypothetical protein GDO86_018589 [Hymenochirus boettgeri]|uniref:G-protein coupled receptors family 1 profile domain-containing protein n=1 Tax=Hymenochirus boettgeri TaxID=247094 RepID=A0A8T2IBV7_9PIPI|nr:hypothetical protein GDO86_018589 [Hymenochirus boettgeri]
MENVSSVNNNFVLLGIVEMEKLKYIYSLVCLFIYIFIMLLNSEIVFVVLKEEILHQPMYILICNLSFNGMLGSSSFFPKFIIDLLTSSYSISHAGCFSQVLSLMTYTFYELYSFTMMAYDRYLAVCHPLRYGILMTKKKAVKLLLSALFFSFTIVLVAVILSARLSFCGALIKNVFCDNLSIMILSCVESSVNNLYGIIITLTCFFFALSIITYSYVKIFLICLKISREARSKAIHTLMTHILGFSIYLVGGVFIFVRFRLGDNSLPMYVHILLSLTFVVFPPLLNPLIYGIRTKALRGKVFDHLNKLHLMTFIKDSQPPLTKNNCLRNPIEL